MTFVAHVVRVLIASPSDTAQLRDAVEYALHEWNGDRSANSLVVLLPRRWETNAVPEMTGEDGQSVINRQLVDDADIVIGIFHSKLGQATPRYASGTAEELHEAKTAGKRVHVYFSAMPIDREHADPEALSTLQAFKDEVEKLGLYGSFDTPESLKHQVRRAIEADLEAFDLAAPTLPPPAARRGASLRATYRDYGQGERLVITNTGDTEAADVTFQLEPAGEEELDAPEPFEDPLPFTLPANGGEIVFPITTHSGTSSTATIRFSWKENGESKNSSHTVLLLLTGAGRPPPPRARSDRALAVAGGPAARLLSWSCGYAD